MNANHVGFIALMLPVLVLIFLGGMVAGEWSALNDLVWFRRQRQRRSFSGYIRGPCPTPGEEVPYGTVWQCVCGCVWERRKDAGYSASWTQIKGRKNSHVADRTEQLEKELGL